MLGYTIYRTVNQLNGMFYIGVHKTANPNDDYLGSGKRLKYAIKKYGVENFVKEVLYSFETKEEAYSKEKELVTEEVLDSGKCYNLKLGGEGGFDHINKNESAHTKNRKSAIMKQIITDCLSDVNFRQRQKDRVIVQNKAFHKSGILKHVDWTGKSHKEETKRKIGEANSICQSGSKNSQFGSKWITDGILNKKIKKDQEIPEGWRSGRIISPI